MATTVAKPKAPKVPKEKKAVAAKKPRAHPPYADMIKEAIASLKERTGSSQYAIAKFIQDKQKDLSPLFKKHISLQLKRLVASGTLTKVKSSYKLSVPVKSPVVKKAPVEKKLTKIAVKKKKSPPASVAKIAAKKSVAKVVEKKPKVVKAKAKVPVKRKAVEKVAPVKKVKSLKSPVKKAKK